MNTLGYLLFIFHETTNERQLTGLLPYWLIPGHAYSLQYCPFSFVFVHGMRGHLAVRKNCLSSSKSGHLVVRKNCLVDFSNFVINFCKSVTLSVTARHIRT
jgi:hypothetical protein